MLNGTLNGTHANGQSRILGADGQPLNSSQAWEKRTQEYGESAVPHVVTFSSLLGRAWRTYRINRADEAMKHGREEALAMKRDAYLQGLLQERKLAVANRPWRIEVDNERDPRQKQVKEGITRVIKDTWRLNRLRYYLHEGIWYGRYGSQLVYEFADIPLPNPSGGGHPYKQRALRVKMHQPVNGDKIDFKWDGTPLMLVHGSEGTQLPGTRTVITDKGRAVLLEGNLRQRFIVHSHEAVDADFFDADSASAVWGIGIRSTLFWLNWLRQEWLANIADWCERTGLGLRLWYYQGGNDKSKTAVTEAARAQSDKTNILIPRFATGGGQALEGVDYVDTASAGADLLLRLQQHVEEHIERYVIGQTLSSSSEGNGLGGTGVAGFHADTKSNITKFDAGNETDTMTADLVPILTQHTYPWADFPVRYVVDVDDSNKKERMEAVRTAFVELGVDFVEDHVRALTGMDAPQEGERTLRQAQAEMQAMQPQPQPGMQPADQEEGDGAPEGLEDDSKGAPDFSKGFQKPKEQQPPTQAGHHPQQQQFARMEHSLGRYAFDESKVHRGQPDNAGQFGPGGGSSSESAAKPAKPEKRNPLKRLAAKTKEFFDYVPAISQSFRQDMRALLSRIRSQSITEEDAAGILDDTLGNAQKWTNKALGTFYNRLKGRAGDDKVNSPEWKKLHDHFREVYQGLREHIDEAASEVMSVVRTGQVSRNDMDAIDSYMDAYKDDANAAVYSIMDVFDEVTGKPRWEGERPKTHRQKAREAVDKAIEAHKQRQAQEAQQSQPEQVQQATLFHRAADMGRYSWEENKHPRDDAGRFKEKLSSMAHGDLRRVGGWLVRRLDDDKYRIDTDEGHVIGGAEKIERHIDRHKAKARLEGKAYTAAVKRGESAGDAPDILVDAERAKSEAERFHGLPHGTRVVSLAAETWGRLGTVERDNKAGRNRVKLDGEPGHVSEWVEPLEEGLSWRVEGEGEKVSWKKITGETKEGLFVEKDNGTAIIKMANGKLQAVNDENNALEMLATAKSLLKSGKLYARDKSLLRSAVERAEAGDFSDLPDRLKRTIEVVAKQDAVNKEQNEQGGKEDLRIAQTYIDHYVTPGRIRKELSNIDEERNKHSKAKSGQIVSFGGTHDSMRTVMDRKHRLELALAILEADKPAPLTLSDLRDDPKPARASLFAELEQEVQRDLFGGEEVRQAMLFQRQGEVGRYGKDEGNGRWITIGAEEGEDGKKHGGSPVYIENGRITKGAPSLVGRHIDSLEVPEEAPPELKGTKRQQAGQKAAKTRTENEREAGYQRAVWGKKARKEGIEPKHLHQLAADLLAHHGELSKDRAAMLKEARSALDEFGSKHRTITMSRGKGGKGEIGDATEIPGLDQVAEWAAQKYPHLFTSGAADDQLFGMLSGDDGSGADGKEGWSEADAYEQAFGHLMEVKANPQPVTGGDSWDDWEEPTVRGSTVDDVVPFARTAQPQFAPANEEVIRYAREVEALRAQVASLTQPAKKRKRVFERDAKGRIVGITEIEG